MADPWESICLAYSGEVIEKFEDNFVSVDRLPDSQQYLKNLESKLARLKKKDKNKKKDLLNSLSETRQSHLERLVDSDSCIELNDAELDQPVAAAGLYRVIAPERQANAIGELVELLKYDQLSKVFEEINRKEEKEETKDINDVPR